MTEEIQQELPNDVVSPGATLAAARKKLGLALPELAKELKVQVNVLEAIEVDKVPKNLPQTFLRGYIRAYAKKVGVDENLVLKTVQTTAAFEVNQQEMQSFSRRNKRKALERRLTIVSWIIGLVLAIALVIWWVRDGGSSLLSPVSVAPTEQNEEAQVKAVQTDNTPSEPEKSEAEQNPQSVVSAEELAAVAETQEPEVAEKNDSVESKVAEEQEASLPIVNLPDEPEVSDAPLQVEAETVIPTDNESTSDIYELTEEQQALVADNGEVDEEGFIKVEMKFDELCYVEIRDVQGEAIAYGNKPKDYVMTLNAQGPLSVLLGHTQGVSVWVNGQPYDMSHLPSNRVARFELEAPEPTSATVEPATATE